MSDLQSLALPDPRDADLSAIHTLEDAVRAFACPSCSKSWGLASPGYIGHGHSFAEGQLYLMCPVCQPEDAARLTRGSLMGVPGDVIERFVDMRYPVRWVAQLPAGVDENNRQGYEVVDLATGEALLSDQYLHVAEHLAQVENHRWARELVAAAAPSE